MLTGHPRTRRAGRVLAALTAAAIAATTAVVGLAGAADAATGPSLTVTTAPEGGGAVTVTGEGFAVDATGVYVGIGATGATSFYRAGITADATVWVAQGQVASATTAPLADDGTFTLTFTAPAPTGTGFSVYASKAHGQGAGSDLTQNVSVPVTYAVAPTPTPTPSPTQTAEPTPTPTPSPTASPEPSTWTPAISVLAADGTTPLGSTAVRAGDTIVVKGSGFDPAANVGGYGVPIPATLSQGAYVVFGTAAAVWKPSAGATSAARKVASQGWVLPSSVVDQVPAQHQPAIRAQWVELADDGTFTARLTIAAPAALDGGSVGVFTYAAGGTKNAAQELFVPVTFTAAPVTPEPTPEPSAPAPALTVSPATGLDASVDQKITVRGTGFAGALAYQGVYVNLGASGTWAPGTAPAQDGWAASGYVPTALIAADGSFTTTLTVKAGTAKAGSTYVAAVFCAHGCSATERSLDAVSGPITFAAASSTPTPTLPTVGGTPVVSVEGVPSNGTITAGTEVTLVATGFAPNQTGIRLELRSDPVVLASGLTADASGTVRVVVTIPAGTPAGSHHLVVVGADGREVAFPVTVAAAVPVCVARAVSGATLTWGVKDAFRSYVTGSIGKGAIATSNVSGSGPWTWSGGTGTFNTTDTVGRAAFAGSVQFTAHGGVLDVTISNPRVQVSSATSATLVADVRTAEKTYSGIALATLRLGDGTSSTTAGKVSWSGVPATLTAAAAPAFEGFYTAGTALDPVSFTLPLGAETDCTSASGASLAKYGKGGVLAATGGDLDALTYALLLVTLGAGLVLVARRRARVARAVVRVDDRA